MLEGEDDDGDGQSGSPPASPPPPKRSRKNEQTDDRTHDSSDGQTSINGQGNEPIEEAADHVSSVLLQQSRSGLTITPSQQQNEIDQAYNDDLAEMLEVIIFLPCYTFFLNLYVLTLFYFFSPSAQNRTPRL